MDTYDRQGNPISYEEYGELLRPDYKRVAETTLPNGVWVSTVWLGLNHSFSDDGPPIIFETMAFADANVGAELNMARYATEEEALAGHEAMVEWAKGWVYEDPS
jgi:hypothetical protein